MNGLRKRRRAAVGQFVAVDAGDNGVAAAEATDGFADVARLFGVYRARLAFGDGAKAAVARADVAQDHEGRRAFAPALIDVRAARLLADRVQAQVANQLMHAVE